MKKNHARSFQVFSLTPTSSVGVLRLGTRQWRCALGRSGRRPLKREGDSATPVGAWGLSQVLYRADRSRRPTTRLPITPIRPADGWCDDPQDRNYNRAVTLPYPASAEHLWRSDHVYDTVVVLDHNRKPRRRGAGSAIFMHLARPGYTPTLGCIALSARDLHQVLYAAGAHARIRIGL